MCMCIYIFVCVYAFSVCVCVCMLPPHVCVYVLVCVPVEARVVGASGAGIIGNCDLLGVSV